MDYTIFVLLYLTGSLSSFLFLYWLMWQMHGTWTKEDRNLAMVFCLASWFFLISLLFIWFIEKNKR